jgi:RimJ/RimL family protein N-acetyltransferase
MLFAADRLGWISLMKALLETPRLRMYALAASDEALFCELFTDMETMRFVGRPLAPVRAAASFRTALRSHTTYREVGNADLVGNIDRPTYREVGNADLVGNIDRPRTEVFLRVVHKSSGQDIGLCSIQNVDLSQRRAELGMMLKPALQAQGLGKEALSALVSYAFGLFPIDETWVQYEGRHTAAERLVISTGFRVRAREDADPGCSKRIGSAFRQDWSPKIVANL